MIRVRVDLPPRAASHYDVVIGRGVLHLLREWAVDASSVVVVSDDRVGPLWRARIQAELGTCGWIEIPAGETHKTLDTLERVWARFEDEQLDRHSLVINFGGGVVGDLGGFAAASFLRGLDFVQVPSTLLAQVDASVGGKVGIDYRLGKNRLGAFVRPRGVLIDLDTLSTLDRRNYRSGFAEVLKHGLIRDRAYFDSCREEWSEDAAIPELESVVRRSVEIKAEVVALDEREGGLRKILNFGHTAGHAIESESLATARPLLHGEALAIGMVIEARLSERRGLLGRDERESIERKIAAFGLPVAIPGEIDVPKAITRITRDKKVRAGLVGWTLLNAIGNAVFDQRVPTSEVTEAMEAGRG